MCKQKKKKIGIESSEEMNILYIKIFFSYLSAGKTNIKVLIVEVIYIYNIYNTIYIYSIYTGKDIKIINCGSAGKMNSFFYIIIFSFSFFSLKFI